MTQIEIHNKINEVVKKNPVVENVQKQKILALIVNNDAKNYFFSKIDERWLDWLWKNGLLDELKNKSDDPTSYGGWRSSELNYLMRIAPKDPTGVVKIMTKPEVATKKDNFNPGIIDRFLWICGNGNLPAEETRKMVTEIKKQKWILLMGAFNDFGFQYEKMFETLKKDDSDESMMSIIDLVRELLSVRPKEEVKKEGYARISTDNPFYFNDLSYTKVFHYLTNVKNEYLELALKVATDILKDIVNLGEKTEPSDKVVFPIQDTFHLYDIDLFSLELGDKEHISHRNDVRQLAATIKELTDETVGYFGNDPKRTQKLYEYFKSLPDSRSMWRLKLYAMSLCPEFFKKELKEAFFKLFEVINEGKSYYDIVSGAEYEKTLKKGFYVLSDEDKQKYVKNVVNYFKKKDDEKKNEKENWHKTYGSRILTVLKEQIEEDENLQKIMEDARKKGFEFISDYKPEPSVKFGGGVKIVSPQAPFAYEEFQKMDVSQIAEKFRSKWSPETLSKEYERTNFHQPINAEGVGNYLKKNISERLQQYIDNAGKFFEREKLDQHYTYSFFRGVQEAVKNNKEQAKKINWEKLITLFVNIKKSGETDPFNPERKGRDKFDSWLVSWSETLSAMTDVIQVLLEEKPVVDFDKYRDSLLSVIEYLLAFSDPKPEDEQLETAGMKTNSSDNKGYLVMDPFTIAINSVRGRAFQALIMFVYQDGKEPEKDVKDLYEKVLEKERTRAIMFMFGHYLPTFYFRDKEWVKEKILPKLFPSKPDNHLLYVATWEGYLANNLYGEMFFDEKIQLLYKQGINLKETEYPDQKHTKDLDEGIAVHFALAFMAFSDKFNFEHPLFNKFWTDGNPKQHSNFVSFIGRSLISGSNQALNSLLQEKPEVKELVKNFWDWLLKNYKDSQPFVEMGFWMSLEKDIFEPKWLAEHTKKTLRKTKGLLDWEYGLMKSIEQLAKDAPGDTLEILRLYFLEGGVRGNNKRIFSHIDKEAYSAFGILYNNPATKIGIYTLIDDLIREGGSVFWNLKGILDEK